MSSILLLGDTSGSITVAAPAVAGSGTLTLPTGTATLGIQGPAFSAYNSSGQTISTTTWTKVQFQTEEFDTNNCYDNSTNYRFTPNVAGYYQLSSLVNVGANISGAISIYKNGSNFKQGLSFSSAGTVFQAWSVTALVYFNGSTDYAEIYLYLTSSQTTQATAPQTYFQGALIRGA